jgi:hypothetical protein
VQLAWMIGLTSVEKDFAVPLQSTVVTVSVLLLHAYKIINTDASIRAVFKNLNFDDVVPVRIVENLILIF